MIVYSSTKEGFQEDVLSGNIDGIIHEQVRKKLHHSVAKNEVNSWRSSLMYMDKVMNDREIPEDSGISIEMRIPQTNKRIDFIVSGKGEAERKNLIIIELKGWEEAEPTKTPGILRTRIGGGYPRQTHPSYQAWSYAALLEDFNTSVHTGNVKLHPCAYLHNYEPDGVIDSELYQQDIDAAPVFLKTDAKKLQDFIKEHIKKGDRGKSIVEIENGRIRPSKKLIESLGSMIEGNREFVMVDEQKLVFEEALRSIRESNEQAKRTLIVEGGPGTGKSVVAVNLLAELIRTDERFAAYVTKNAAPRKVYEEKLTGLISKSRFNNLFLGSGKFVNSEPNSFGALIVDEAHRLREKDLPFKPGENQIKEIIQATPASVFFIDEDQQVTYQDIGSKDEIRHFAAAEGAEVEELELPSQFRCNGSDDYLAWLDMFLGIRHSEAPTFEPEDYDFRIFESPTELDETIRQRNEESEGGARLVAGYCWDWVSKKDQEAFDIVFPEYDFAKKWNLEEDGPGWINRKGSIDEVGCIHTCQGLELDYIGVIIGPDLYWDEHGRVHTDPSARAKTDNSLHGYKKDLKRDPECARAKADRLIRNTYKVLMSRGLKGCYVWVSGEG